MFSRADAHFRTSVEALDQISLHGWRLEIVLRIQHVVRDYFTQNSELFLGAVPRIRQISTYHEVAVFSDGKILPGFCAYMHRLTQHINIATVKSVYCVAHVVHPTTSFGFILCWIINKEANTHFICMRQNGRLLKRFIIVIEALLTHMTSLRQLGTTNTSFI